MPNVSVLNFLTIAFSLSKNLSWNGADHTLST